MPRWRDPHKWSGVGLTFNGLVCLALALIAKHAFDQIMVYNLFAVIGMLLVFAGLYRLFGMDDF